MGRLGIIDTPGFGDHINKEDAWKPIEDYIDTQYSTYLTAESRIQRQAYLQDTRIHACLYFVPPRVHGLRKIDLEFLARLHEQVTIIPVIAKADSLTIDERRKMKSTVRRQLEENKIFAYYFPEETTEQANPLVAREYKKDTKFCNGIEEQPFSVIGSNFMMDGRIRARKYPWGVVDIENVEHSDLRLLRDCIMKTN